MTFTWYGDAAGRYDQHHTIGTWLEKGWFMPVRCANGHERTLDHHFLGRFPREVRARDLAERLVCSIDGCGARVTAAYCKQGYDVNQGPPS